jgi:hypothetical protein
MKLVVQLPTATDPNATPHKFTLSNEDGSYSTTLTYPADAQPGPADGVSILTFENLTDGHSYSLQAEGDDGTTYVLLQSTPYHRIAGDGSSPDSAAAPGSSPADGGTGTTTN